MSATHLTVARCREPSTVEDDEALSRRRPVKSGFDQVHQASGFGAFELSQNPVSGID
jgi:hypothetical protein